MEFEFANEESQNEIVQASHHSSSIMFAHAGTVFMQSDVSAVMQAILNAPIRALSRSGGNVQKSSV